MNYISKFLGGDIMNTKPFDVIALILVIIGALNWGLVGFFEYNLVDGIFGAGSVVARIIYALVGIAGIYSLSLFGRIDSRIEKMD